MEILPISIREQITPLCTLRSKVYFIINQTLDAPLLQDALTRLIRDHWRTLGARLVTRPSDGVMEYHLPTSFEEGYELFRWSTKEYEGKIGDVVVNLPRLQEGDNGGGVQFFPHLSVVESYFRPPTDWPSEQSDDPAPSINLYVHLSLFADATVLAVNMQHAFGDQFALSNIIRAWLGLARGEIPAPLVGGGKNDILRTYKSYAECTVEEKVRKGRIRVRGNFEYPMVIAGVLPEIVMNREEAAYTMFLSKEMVDALREKYTVTLKEHIGSDPGLTNGDIVTAILLKLSQIHSKSTSMMALSQTINLRGRHPSLLPPNSQSFIHNALTYATAHFQLTPTLSLGEIAHQNRLAINQATGAKDINITLAVLEEMSRLKQPMVTCEPWERFYSVTNWTAAWRGLDFSPSVKSGKEGKDIELLVMGESTVKNKPGRFSPQILCKTKEGYWCNMSVSLKTDKLIKEYLAKDPKLENL